jgi:hypothetical protein
MEFSKPQARWNAGKTREVNLELKTRVEETKKCSGLETGSRRFADGLDAGRAGLRTVMA